MLNESVNKEKYSPYSLFPKSLYEHSSPLRSKTILHSLSLYHIKKFSFTKGNIQREGLKKESFHSRQSGRVRLCHKGYHQQCGDSDSQEGHF